jgi:hypothetical protein
VLAVVIVMVVILLVAGLVAAYVAYPHRGEEMPAAPWLGDVMAKAADAAPLLEDEDESEFRLHEHDESPQRR